MRGLPHKTYLRCQYVDKVESTKKLEPPMGRLNTELEASKKVNMPGREEIQCFIYNFLHTMSHLKLGFIEEPTDTLPEVYFLNYAL